jgi:chorismate dehydratase
MSSSIDPPTETNLKVGRIPFVVCAPYFYRSIEGFPQTLFVDGSPAQLNQALEEGRIDCAPSSSIEYAKNYKDYYILPRFSTGGHSKVRSVLFFSKVPWDTISNKPVLLSPASASSNTLFKILCKSKYHVEPVFRSIQDDEEPLETVGRVSIGDEALHLSYYSSWPYCYDLAEEWYKWQGLPFSFGLWIVRKEAAQQKSTSIRTFVQHLEETREAFSKDPEGALDTWLAHYPSDVPKHLLLSFLETVQYRLTPNHEKSLRLFFKFAWEAGYIPELPKLEFLPGFPH